MGRRLGLTEENRGVGAQYDVSRRFGPVTVSLQTCSVSVAAREAALAAREAGA